jgi:chemotaxis protein MotB
VASPNSNGVMNGTAGLFGDLEGGEGGSEVELEAVHKLAKEFYQMLDVAPDEESPVEIEVTSDGLRVTVFDRGQQPIFDPGGADFTDFGRFVMQNLSWLVDRHDLMVRVDAHADATTQASEPLYGSFELTADRANAARRTMEHYALDPAKVERVTGYGATQPRADADSPGDNDRLEISLSLD